MVSVLRSSRAVTLYGLCRALPLELIQLILKHAILDNPKPLAVAAQRSRICLASSFLAGVLYSFAPVWDHLYLGYDTNITVDSIYASIKNSVARPLNLSVHVWKGPDGPLAADRTKKIRTFLHTFFSVLQPHFHRLRAIDIICWDREGSETILDYITKSDCSGVEDMRLALILTQDPDIDTLRGPFMSSLPSLRTMRVQRSFLPSCFEQVGKTATDLRIALIKEVDRATWEDVRHMLLSFPIITHLELAGVPCAFFPPLQPPKIRFDFLTHLCVMIGSKSMMDVVQTLSAPALSHLKLVTLNRRAVTMFISSASHLLSRPVTVRFDFAGNFRARDIAAVLGAFTSARVLDLSYCRSRRTTRVVDALKILGDNNLQITYLPSSFIEQDIMDVLSNASLRTCEFIVANDLDDRWSCTTYRLMDGNVFSVRSRREELWSF
ncbi:hypothetical protein C8R47DRAFT_1095642 [Mycena vitilis]|nr:hypothetical protein C8R47DRAFT_1095642 [Mycena vitilis]